MKNKKGQLNLSWIVLVAVSIIVGLILLQAAYSSISNNINLATVTNEAGRINETSYTLVNCNGVTLTSVTNGTSGVVIDSGNYTYDSATCGFTNATSVLWNPANFSYTYQPSGYITDSSSRALISLTIVLSALAIAIFSIPNLREYISDFF